ncbi:MAG: C4-dicarboxylate ABC transporter substrate-binding protein [Piscirickettsiaceae bacterium]|nr:MAG: C4-dicarboxylate ABC transporter substrate-binding protein [Piscirickettsiaceae bacterium]
MAGSKRTSKKDSLLAGGAGIVLLTAGFWLAYQFVEPAPPTTISISTGSQEGAYYANALKYKTLLAEQGITLNIKTSAGSTENLQRLLSGETDLALVQGGLTQTDTPLQSLGSLYYEPIWIFHQKSQPINKLTDLAGKKVAIGPEGSGTRSLASLLLADNQLNNITLVDSAGSTAVKQLISGDIDAAFFIGSVQSSTIQTLINQPSINLVSLDRADAYKRLHPFLSKVTLPEGIIDLKNNIPSAEKTLLAPTANLLMTSDFHPALSILVLQAIQQVHRPSGLLANASEFPNTNNLTAPISDVADRFYKKGPPFLMRYLPFWTAIMIDRFIVMLVPLLVLLIPLAKVLPPLYRWRISSRIYRWYESLHEVDDKIHGITLNDEERVALHTELSRIENEVNKVKTPLSYAEKVYHLLAHINLVRNKLQK